MAKKSIFYQMQWKVVNSGARVYVPTKFLQPLMVTPLVFESCFSKFQSMAIWDDNILNCIWNYYSDEFDRKSYMQRCTNFNFWFNNENKHLYKPKLVIHEFRKYPSHAFTEKEVYEKFLPNGIDWDNLNTRAILESKNRQLKRKKKKKKKKVQAA